MNVKLPDGTIITMEQFAESLDPAWVTEEIDKKIIEELKEITTKEKHT